MAGKYGGTMKKTYKHSKAVPVDLGDNPQYEGTYREVKNGKVCYYPTTQGPIEGDKASGSKSSNSRY